MLTLTPRLWRANYPYTDNLALSCMILLDEVTSGGVMKEIASSSKIKSKIRLKEKHVFDAQALFDSSSRAATGDSSWPSRPGDFHPEPSHRSVLDCLPSHGSCHPVKVATFRPNRSAPPVSS